MLRFSCVPESENLMRASTQNSSEGGSIGEDPAGQKETPGACKPGRFQGDMGGVPKSPDAILASVLTVLQARNSVDSLMDIDAKIAADPAQIEHEREEVERRFRECWAIYEACFPSGVRRGFKPLFGVKFRRFEFALSAVALALAPPEVRGRTFANPGAVLGPQEVFGE